MHFQILRLAHHSRIPQPLQKTFCIQYGLIFCSFLFFAQVLQAQWVQVGADIDGEATFDRAGHAVSLSADGSTLAVGANFNDGSGQDAGHVRVYQNVGGIWTQISTDIDGEAAGDWSGYSVSLSASGSILAIGAPYNNAYAGHVRVYQNIGGTWTQVGADIDGEAAGDLSGHSVSLSFDGSVLAIGAPYNNGSGTFAGHVRVYQNIGGNWTQVGADIDGEAVYDQSGYSVALSSDGSILAVGAILNDGNSTNVGHVRVYQNISGTWTQVGADIDGEAAGDESGYSVALSSNGSTLAVGAIFNDGNGLMAGHVRVYQNIGGTWTQVGADIDGETAGDSSGESVSLSSDGAVLAIGSSNNANVGHVRVYQNIGSVWTQVGTDIDGEAVGDGSGKSVSLSSGGYMLAVGSPGNNSNTGHVRVYNFAASPDADSDGYTTAQGDCDDNNPLSFPGAAEICDGLDNDCDGLTDEGPSRWQNTIGGSGNEIFGLTKPTADGGYIVGGTSNSNISGDKTENSRGAGDFWVLKLDAAGDIVWQKTIGGNAAESLSDLNQTADGGYIVAGHSFSPTSGEKTEDNAGGADFWILKLDATGNIVWQNTIGGDGNDFLPKISQTSNGHYILAGTSSSNISGDKTEAGLGGSDIWLLELDASGNLLWQNTIGGSGSENVRFVEQTPDGGYVVGSQSDSNTSGDKTEDSNGFNDYWLLKLDATGDIEWQNTIGGSAGDYLEDAGLTTDGGYILCGYSASDISGDKSENSRGGFDFWVLKLNASGHIAWQKTFGGANYDTPSDIYQTADGGYLVGGYSESGISGDKTQAGPGGGDNWLLELDPSGNIVSQNTFGGTGYDSPSSVRPTADGGYVVGGISNSNTSGDKTENSLGGLDFWVIKFAPDTDTELPVITCPPNTTVAADASCSGEVGSHSAATASDNCGTVNVTQSPAPSTALNGHNDSETVTLTADDTHGNVASCSFTVTLKDVAAPSITCPPNATVAANASCSGEVGSHSAATASDNCGTPTVTQSPSAGTALSGHNDVETVTLTATDGNLNTATCSFTVTLKDVAPPSITCPTAIVTSNPVVTYTAPVGTDNCTGAITTQTDATGLSSGSAFPVGTTTVLQYTVTDGANLSTSCQFTVTVTTGNTPPSITCPANVTTNVTPNTCSKVVIYTPPVGTDNEPGVTTAQTDGTGLTTGSSFPTGTTTLQYTVTDAGGLTSACVFTVKVLDNVLPSITCPYNIVRVTDAGLCSAVATYTTPTFSDNCPGAALTRTDGPASGSVFPKGITMVNWKVTDASGNSSVCGFTVTVNDTQQPSIICPSNQSISTTIGQCTGVATFATPSGSDNCALPANAVTQTSGLPSGSAFPKGANTVTFKVTDATGLFKTCTFRVTVNDTENPSITCPPSQTKNTDPGLCTAMTTYAAPTYGDNCPGGTVVRTSGLPSGAHFPKGQTVVVWRAMDAVGRSSTCAFTVTVTDNQSPTVTCPPNIAVTAPPGQCSAVVTYPPSTATDNCGVQSVFLLSGLPSGSTFPQGATVNTWRAVDDSGGSGTCTFTVTVGCGASPNSFVGREEAPDVASEEEKAAASSYRPLRRGWERLLLLAPNPADTEIRAELLGEIPDKSTLNVLDLTGRFMRSIPVLASVAAPVDVSDLPPGTYFLHWTSDGRWLAAAPFVVARR